MEVLYIILAVICVGFLLFFWGIWEEYDEPTLYVYFNSIKNELELHPYLVYKDGELIHFENFFASESILFLVHNEELIYIGEL